MDLDFSAAQHAFRDEVRTWLAEHKPREPRPHDAAGIRDYDLGWQRTQYEGGWAGISWPAEYGGVPDDEWGARLVAVVVPEPGASVDGEEIRDFVRARLRGSRTPDNVVFRTELSHTPTGKLLRRELVRDV